MSSEAPPAQQVTGAFSFAASLLVRFLCTRNNWHKGKQRKGTADYGHEHENTLKTFSPDPLPEAVE